MDILEMLSDAVVKLANNLGEFYDQIISANEQVDTMILSCSDPTVDGGLMIMIIGNYRYIVGDKVFMATYMLLLIGIGYSIYKIAILIKNNFSNFQNFGKGIGSFFKGFFSYK